MSGVCLIFGAIGYASSSGLLVLIVFIFFIGLGLGSLELSGSNVISEVHTHNKGRYLNLLNAFYGVGSIITPIVTGYLLNSGVSWRVVYRYSLFVDKLGHLKSLLLFSAMSVFCITLGVFGPSSISIVLAFTGFCFSIIFPTSTAVIYEIPTKNAGTMLGIFFAFGGLGGMVGPWLVGIINDALELKAGMAVNSIFCVIVMTVLIILMGSKTRIRETEEAEN